MPFPDDPDPARRTPSRGAPARGAPARGAPARGAPAPGAPARGTPTRRSPIVVVGGGIVGLAVARALLQRDPDVEVVVFEKEAEPARHQTGRNSGVLHSGVYYRPASAKARLCRSGKTLLEAFCAAHSIPFERCGKVVVATAAAELPRLDELERRAIANGASARRIGPERVRELEPHVRGVAALHVPESGIVDYVAVARALAERVAADPRGSIHHGREVRAIVHRGDAGVDVGLRNGETVPARAVIACAGLHGDRVARRAGARPSSRIVPFRGEYFELRPEARHLVRNLVYPVPDPRFPFLGVHFTRRIDGGVECGPNAVFALAREGYRWRDVSPTDLFEALSWPGTLRLFARHWRTGLGETWRSLSKPAFVRALQRLVPEIREEHLVRAPAGVRAQAIARDGTLVDDFAIEAHGRALHVLNAPSPAATASLAIAEEIVDRARDVLA